MLRLRPTTITLTGNDIALAMNHMQASKANATEISTSATPSPHSEQQLQKPPGKHHSKIHRQLQILLANNEDYVRVQRNSEDVSYDDLDGSFEELSIRSDDAEEAVPSLRRNIDDSLDFLPALSLSVGPSTGYRTEGAAWESTNEQEIQPYNFPHLDGVSMSLSAEDWYHTRTNSPIVTDEVEYLSGVITHTSTPVLSPASSALSSPSSRGPNTPSPRATGVTLREGTASAGASSEYYITSTCPEFVGPSEAFSLMTLLSDPSHLSTTAHSPTIATDFVSPNNSSEPEAHIPLASPQNSMFNFHRRTMGTYNNPGNVEHTESIFSPFTYSPEEPVLDYVDDESLVPSPPTTEWDDADRGQEGGAAWDLRGRRM